MLIKEIRVNHFRNYTNELILLDKGLNIIAGENASGKTNLLEAIYLSSIGRSPRTTQDKDLIQWGNDYLYVSLLVAKKYHTHKIEIHIDHNKNKRIAIDGMPVLRVGELMGTLNVIYFSPDELKMIKEAPKERRRFMDISLSQQKKVYFYNIQKYNKILDQRNKLLKSKYSYKALEDMLPVWDIQLSDVGAEIILQRLDFVSKLNNHARKQHSIITQDKEILEINYESENIAKSKEDIKQSLLDSHTNSRDKDYHLKYTSNGPHRDDIKITINDIDVRKFGSQGQQRSAALSLKLAEISHFEQETGEKPVLLLDDVLSELDTNRQKQLINATADIQTLLTCTEYDLITDVKVKMFNISKGKCTSIIG